LAIAGVALISAIAAVIFLMERGGTPQSFTVFGVTPESLARDGVAVYPPDDTPKISPAQAEGVARGERLRGDPIIGIELVHLKHEFDPKFDGLAWVVAFDVAGKQAVWPGDSQLPKGTSFVYSFDLVFIDAATGDRLFRLAESGPGSEQPLTPFAP
jgi:hypothetical protein